MVTEEELVRTFLPNINCGNPFVLSMLVMKCVFELVLDCWDY